MKKPEEIKKGLEIAVNGCLTCDCCITDCPYDPECHPMNEDTNVDMPKQMAADAIAYIKQLENHIRDLTKKLKQLEVAQPRWISVIDEMPAPETRVLASAIDNDGESIVVITEYTHRLYGLGLTGWLEPWQYFSCNYKITHWMPMPEAPKEGE